jgi:hypothetical protein
MAEYFILHNYHLILFKALMFVGGLLFFYMPIHCMNRTGVPTFWGLKAWLDMNENEWKVLVCGFLIFLIGLIGHHMMKEKYGQFSKMTDENGHVEYYHSESWIKYERQR